MPAKASAQTSADDSHCRWPSAGHSIDCSDSCSDAETQARYAGNWPKSMTNLEKVFSIIGTGVGAFYNLLATMKGVMDNEAIASMRMAGL